MTTPKQQFKKPAKPLSFKETVNKILKDADYAKFFRGEVVKARKGNKEAEKIIAAHFKFRPDELKALDLPKGFGSCSGACTDTTATTTNLFEFVTPVHVWPKKPKKD
jgi:hypothetical protein